MRNLFLTLFLLLSIKPLFAENGTVYYFNRFSSENGLTQATVRKVLRDSDGFLWIGTSFGLNRFDGQQLTTFISSEGETNGLPGNRIYYMAEDGQKNIWVSSNNGLTLFDKNSQSFVMQRINGNNFESYAYCLLPDGMVCASSMALFKYEYQTRGWRELPIVSARQPAFHFTDIVPWNDETLLLNSRFNGLFLYNLKSGALTEIVFHLPKNTPTVFVDSQKRVWISSYGDGLYCYSQDGKLIRKYSTENSLLSNDVILEIVEIDGSLWLGTDGGGINILNPESGVFRHIKHTFEDLGSFPANSALTIYKDGWGSLWVGTVRNGLIEIKNGFMKTFSLTTFGNHHGLSQQTVLALHEDDDGIIWIGTDGGGVNKFNPKTNEFEHFAETINDKVTSITRQGRDELLISVFDRGVFYFNKKTGKKRQLLIVNDEINARIAASGFSTFLHSNDGVVTQIISDDIYLYNGNSNSFSTITFPKEENTPRRILKKVSSDSENEFFYTFTKIYRKKSNAYELLWSQPNNADLINAVAKDANNHLWIATSAGIRRFKPETRLFDDYISAPAHNNIIKSLVCDYQNRLWIGTRTNLWLYYIDEERFEIFDKSNGLTPDEYLENATLVAKSGDIYMGGVGGLLHINKNIVPENTPPPRIKLTEVSTGDTKIYRFGAQHNKPPQAQQINLSWRASSVTFRIIIQEKDIFSNHRIRYYIPELSKDPIETADRFLTLHSLSSGQYTVSVSHDLPNGTWSAPAEILTLNIAPPWWKTTWFFLLAMLVLLAVVALTLLYFVKKKENGLKWQMQEREKEISAEKVRFLINVSHELRTPLTLMYAPLGRLLKQPLAEELRNPLQAIYRQGTKMKKLINMVLDIDKIESGNEKLLVEHHKLHDWIREISGQFADEFKHCDIRVNYRFDERITEVPFDGGKCEIVLSNILSNALKFSPPNSSINISTILKEKDNSVQISISDEGIGLNGINTEKLFARFYQGNHRQGGSGIGLAFSKLLIELHGGSIHAADNENGKGAVFFINLPLTNPAGANATHRLPATKIRETAINTDTEIAADALPRPLRTSAANYSILLVEDNPELLRFLKETLEQTFKKVLCAPDGKKALEIARRDMPDVIVSDVVMPLMDGFELCRRIKSDIEISHIPVILLTARGDSESMRQGYKLGADAYVSKPFDMDFLQTIIKNRLTVRESIKKHYKEHNAALSPQEVTFSNADERFLLKLNDLINENITNPSLNVNFLSAEIGMSRTSLYNKMNELLNVGIKDYINRIRFEKAAALLTANPDLDIAEVASSLGFSSQGYFSTSFKQYKGISPSEYRKQARGD